MNPRRFPVLPRRLLTVTRQLTAGPMAQLRPRIFITAHNWCPHQNWLYCSMVAPKSGKQSITMSVTNMPTAQNCTVAIRSGSTNVFAGRDRDHSGFASLARNSVGIGSFPLSRDERCMQMRFPTVTWVTPKILTSTEQLDGGQANTDDARSRAWCPKEIKSADGQFRLSSVYGRSAVLE